MTPAKHLNNFNYHYNQALSPFYAAFIALVILWTSLTVKCTSCITIIFMLMEEKTLVSCT